MNHSSCFPTFPYHKFKQSFIDNTLQLTNSLKYEDGLVANQIIESKTREHGYRYKIQLLKIYFSDTFNAFALILNFSNNSTGT